jgi:hypothetical protein
VAWKERVFGRGGSVVGEWDDGLERFGPVGDGSWRCLGGDMCCGEGLAVLCSFACVL